jgi:hypothetical protein
MRLVEIVFGLAISMLAWLGVDALLGYNEALLKAADVSRCGWARRGITYNTRGGSTSLDHY